jgi:cation diffusion facilitator CzcD-associated flavoprotein CzcO
MDHKKIHTLIIGAGPAGLATAGRLRKLDLPFEVLEASTRIADSWHRHYDRLCLHTVKELSALPHYPFPDDYPQYVPREKLIRYFESYANRFGISPLFLHKAVRIVRNSDRQWTVETSSGPTFKAENVVVTTGFNRIPKIPHWPGEKIFSGEIIHSRNYKNPVPFSQKKVLVIGMGNTGAEIALDLSLNGVQTWLSVRNEVVIVPRDVFGNPAQLTGKKLEKLPFGLGGWIANRIRRLLFDDLKRYGLRISPQAPVKMLEATGKTPVIDIGTADQIRAGSIKVVPGISEFQTHRITFTNEESLPFDAVILATGYRPQLQDMIPGIEEILEKADVPSSPIGFGKFEGLYFVGFDNFKLGGILGTIYEDSEFVAKAIQKKK